MRPFLVMLPGRFRQACGRHNNNGGDDKVDLRFLVLVVSNPLNPSYRLKIAMCGQNVYTSVYQCPIPVRARNPGVDKGWAWWV